jgi:hypothetical protein
MRHSDPKLTANVYTDPVLLDVAGAVNALPALPALNATIISTKSTTPAETSVSKENGHAAVARA